jgi:glycosyltransferase involved in cell wall biosynthesis
MNKFRFHIPALEHLPVSEKYMGCAYTQKIVKLSKMMLSLGHEVYVYGAEGSDVPCTEFIQTHALQDIKDSLGDGTDNELGYDWETKGINEVEVAMKIKDYLHGKFVVNCITEINKRKQKKDFLLLPVSHKSIADGVGLDLTVESGIGYINSFARFRIFESRAIQYLTYGAEAGKHIIRPNPLDTVIPNFFDLKDFEYKSQKQDYFLFVGRLIYVKGITIAVKVAEALKTKLLIAGQGAYSWDEKTHRLTGREFDVVSDYIEYIGYINQSTRKMLMANAKAVLVPSLYSEPFGGVNVEAQLSGTPVLTTPFGAFPETIRHGVTGFICDTNDEFVEYAKRVGELNPTDIRKHAERYSMDVVKFEYQKWFELLYSKVK